jgi:TPR repeat protein
LKEALKWLRLAAKQGQADAQLSLGAALFYGEGTNKDWGEALRWYRKAAKQGNSSAQFNIGHMYRCGEGLPKDWNLAIHWYLRAAMNDNVGAMHWLGRIYGGRSNTRKIARRPSFGCCGLPREAMLNLSVRLACATSMVEV